VVLCFGLSTPNRNVTPQACLEMSPPLVKRKKFLRKTSKETDNGNGSIGQDWRRLCEATGGQS